MTKTVRYVQGMATPKYATYSSFTDCVNIFLNLGGPDADVTDVGILSWCIV